jgi:hypothetical protein
VLELAGVEGLDTTDPERAAELLVLQGVYEDTEAAQAGLRARPAPAPAEGTPRRSGRIATLRDLTLRMARLLGIVTPADDTRRALLGQWSLTGLVFLTGLVAPLVWLPYMAVSYHRATTRLTDRATSTTSAAATHARPARPASSRRWCRPACALWGRSSYRPREWF